jgi:hypothetical protein
MHLCFRLNIFNILFGVLCCDVWCLMVDVLCYVMLFTARVARRNFFLRLSRFRLGICLEIWASLVL